MAKTLKKMLISTIVVLMMVFSAAFIGISSSVNAQPSASPTPVGTFTLNPATGAFPGQLVTYTWTGVPSTLVPPVYVTVYLNNVPYGNPTIATYDSMSGTLTGTFIMPNANPGTVFMVSLSYRDSAQNYGVSSSSISTQGNVYGAPIKEFTTTTNTQFGAPYIVTANVNYSGIQKTNVEFNGGNGQVSGYTNTTFNVSSTNSKTLASKNIGEVNLVGSTNYVNQFFTNQSTQTLSINATAFNNGPASLSLAASSIFTSTFSISSTAKTIENINLLAYLNQTVNGQPVNFTITGKYTSPITSNGTYTMLGTIKATGNSPPLLIKDFSGNIAASYAINFTFTSTKTWLNYTLSVKITGGTSNGVLTLNAQYLNSTVNTNSVVAGSTSIKSNDKLTVQSGYTFESTYVGLENPGITGIFIQNFSTNNKKLWTGNLTLSFTNYTMGKVSNIVVWYDNQSVKISLVNQTLNGYMNVTVKSNFYSPGVEYISPAVWNVSLGVEFKLTNQYGLMLYNTSKYSSVERQLNINITTLLSSGQTVPVSENVTISPASTFVDKVGYLYLNSVTVPYISFTLTYGGQSAIVMQNVTWTGNTNLTTGLAINKQNVYSEVKGFNVTLVSSSGINLYVKVSKVNPVIYALGGIGSITITDINITGAPTWSNSYIKETSYSANFTTPINMIITNMWGAISKGTNTNMIYVNFTLRMIYGSVNYAEITSGKVSFESPYFIGAISMTGKSYSNIGSKLTLSSGSSSTSPGNITSIIGFQNTTILGWYNTTFKVTSVTPALYGGLFNGYAIISISVEIQNVSHSLNIDPWFTGLQNASLNITILSNTTKYSNVTFTEPDLSQNLTLTGYGRIGYLNNFELSTSFSITNSLYNLTDNFAYSAIVKKVSFFNSSLYGNSSLESSQLIYVSGDVHVTVSNYNAELIANIGSPIQNLTLTPIANISFWVYFNATNGIDYHINNVLITNTYYSIPFTNSNNTVFSIRPVIPALGSAEIKATVEESQINIQTFVNNIVITTNPFYVANFGNIPVSGLVTGDHGIGTASGILTVSKIYPASIDEIQLTGNLNATIINANGTQYGILLKFLNTPIMLNTESTVLVPITINATVNYVTEMSNTGITSNSIYYQLVEGSGALIVSVTNSTIATIVSKLNQTIQVPLNELNAKITAINGTLVTIETAFGYMNSTLNALNAKITAINGTLVTIKTDLGTITTSLNSINATVTSIKGNIATISTSLGTLTGTLNELNAKITAINGTLVTITTDLGTITTSLNSINATVTSINGNIATISTSLGT
ncbi:MAG: hypothetical protein QXN68_01365, partial [Thermoplasmata archaeon]